MLSGIYVALKGTSTEVYAQSDAIESPAAFVISVDISGAVRVPGVYQLESGARVVDALESAGGFHEEVDRIYVAQVLNAAEYLEDGEKIYIPFAVEVVPSSETSNSPTGIQVNLNQASEEELRSLVGVGEKRAAAILEQRPIQSVEQLIEAGVITQKIIDDNEGGWKL